MKSPAVRVVSATSARSDAVRRVRLGRVQLRYFESGEELCVGEDGMLLVTGPNVMKGYANLEEKTREAIQDGWYVTGDIAHVDDQGFIHITGRQSRFSKIGGEMVPHVRVEEELGKIVCEREEDEAVRVCVTAVLDENEIPMLGTGKFDLKRAREVAAERLSAEIK